jgi:hypothetical protein
MVFPGLKIDYKLPMNLLGFPSSGVFDFVAPIAVPIATGRI